MWWRQRDRRLRPSAMSQFYSFALAKYLSNCISSPLQVVTLLRQIEYAPSESYLALAASSTRKRQQANDDPYSGEQHEEDASFDTSSEFENDHGDADDAPDVYPEFASSANQAKSAFASNHNEFSGEADVTGYLVRTGNEDDDPTIPPYEVSVLGLSSMGSMSVIVNCEDEGIMSLWKGCHTSWIGDMCHVAVQPSVEGWLNDVFDIRDDSIPLVHLDNVGPTFATLIFSHAISGILLSPLELIRTRLVAQTSNPYHRKYLGTFDCLRKIIQEEGIISLLFPRSFVPTVLYHLIQPIFQHAKPLIIERWFNVSSELAPISFRAFVFALHFLEIGILMPLETVRRRIECQVISRTPGDRPFETMVSCTPIPYMGMIDCMNRIICEEGGEQVHRSMKGNKRSKKRKSSKRLEWSIGSLYRGFKLRLIANGAILLLRAVVDDDNAE